MSETGCAKCGRPFSDEPASYDDSPRQYQGTPFCSGCVNRCADSEIADHWCAVDRWRTEQRAGASQ